MEKRKIIKVGTSGKDARLYVVVSPNEMNQVLNTVIVCPLITTKRNIPTQMLVKAAQKSGLICDCYLALDQISTIEKSAKVTVVGELSELEMERATAILQEMFAL